MANVLILTDRVPWPLSDGHALRVLQLSRHASGHHRFHLATLGVESGSSEAEALGEVFSSITFLPPFPSRRHWQRFLRLSNSHYMRKSSPRHFAAVTLQLQCLLRQLEIDIVVAVQNRCEELIRRLQGVGKLVDQYDSLTLMLERAWAANPPQGPRDYLRRRHRLFEARRTEAALGDHVDALVAISPADAKRLGSLTRERTPVELVPNGIDPRLLDLPEPTDPVRRAVVFWGNLSFPVNRDAVWWFYNHVWRPRLEASGIRWCIVGPNADENIKALAAKNPDIEIAGFIPDLFTYLSPYAVMINPMVSGGGLKNKLLEALAAGKAVVSTSMGAEALPVTPGIHCRIADHPHDFANAIEDLLTNARTRHGLVIAGRRLVSERYTWSAVGELWSSVLAKYGGVQRG